MNRRAFLGSAAVAFSLGVVGQQDAPAQDSVTVRVWFSEAAAAYDGLEERVEGYLGVALREAFDSVDVTFAPGTVSLPSEGGRDVLAFHWPQLVVEGIAGLREIDASGDVNLLVTDGDPTRQPAGYARPHVAAVTGAEHIVGTAPADEVGSVVPYSVANVATQLLLHECGHALGLGHEHGTARVRGDAVVASPMIGSYFWKSERVREKHLADEANTCGGSYPTDYATKDRGLRLRYADCAVQALR